MTTVGDDLTSAKILVEQGSTPASPSAGNQKLFIRTSDHKLCRVNSAGAVTVIEGFDTAAIDATGTFKLSGDISPAQITSNQNDYNPTGLSTASVLRLNTDASRNITGLQGGADGRIVVIVNVGSFNIVLKDADSGSSAANRFALSSDITLAPDDGVILQYDSTSTVWRCIGKSPGGAAGSGDVVGPASAVNNNIVKFDTTTGKLIKDGGTFGSNLWTQVVNESGAAFTNWTSGGGTWSSDGTVIKQTDTGTTFRTAKYNTTVDLSSCAIFEANVKLVSAGGSAALRSVGIIIGYSGSNTSAGPAGTLRNTSAGTKTANLETAFTAIKLGITNAFAEDTFIKLRVVSSGGFLSFYVDGTLQGNAGLTIAASADARYVGLLSYGCEAHFKDIKAWNITGTYPA